MNDFYKVAYESSSQIIAAMIQHGDFGNKIDPSKDLPEIARVYKELSKILLHEMTASESSTNY